MQQPFLWHAYPPPVYTKYSPLLYSHSHPVAENYIQNPVLEPFPYNLLKHAQFVFDLHKPILDDRIITFNK
jgi:hypothetical protein